MMDSFDNLDGYYGEGLSTTMGGDGSAFSMSNNFSHMQPGINYSQQVTFPEVNDDLNSFFTPGLGGQSKGMLNFGNANESLSMPLGQWDNGEGLPLFCQQQEFPFPATGSLTQHDATMDSSLAIDPNWQGGRASTAPIDNPKPVAPSDEHCDDVDKVEKPKRGRPRKRKRKEQLSEEEQQKKREAFLERNRRAASKCRKRKKESTEGIQARVSLLDKESRMLTAELIHLRAEHARFLNLALQHANTCPNNAIFQSTIDAAANNRLAISGDPFMDWEEFTRNAMKMDQNSVTESMLDQYYEDSEMSSILKDSIIMSREHSRDSQMSSSSSRNGLVEPIDQKREHTNVDVKEERKKVESIADGQSAAGTTSQHGIISQRSKSGTPHLADGLQGEKSFVMSWSSSNSSKSSRAGSEKSFDRDSSYSINSPNATTPPTPGSLESPDVEHFQDIRQLMPGMEVYPSGGLIETPAQLASGGQQSGKIKAASGPADLADPPVCLSSKRKC